jgi:hypothetical protein
MKLGKVGALCKSAKRFVIYRTWQGQWISDGCAIYPIRELPMLKEDNVFALFDIPEDKREKVQYSEGNVPYGIDLADACDDEVVVQLSPISLVYKGAVFTPMRGRSGILYIDRKYISPFGDDITLYERYYPRSERSYIAVKRGLLLEGIILPAEIATKELSDTLKHISELTALVAGVDVYEAEQEEIGI